MGMCMWRLGFNRGEGWRTNTGQRNCALERRFLVQQCYIYRRPLESTDQSDESLLSENLLPASVALL